MSAGRRGNNEGTISKRDDGRWMARISLENGTRQAFYGKTRAEVAKRLAQAMHERAQGLPIVSEKQTVAQFFASWLTTAKPSIKVSTFERYEDFVRLHVVPVLGKRVLSRLTPPQLQSFYNDRIEAGSSPTTVNHIHNMVHLALDSAMRLGLVARNVADYVTPPRPKRHPMQVLTPEQARAFLRAATSDPLEALYVLALSTGLRQGELRALKWQDIDVDQRHLQVRATVRRTRSGFLFTEPKSARSRRKVVLTGGTAELLRQHRIKQLETRLVVGDAWQDNDLVFPNSVGRPIEVSNLRSRSFQRLIERAGVPKIRFHDLRHTAATLLLLQGIHPKVVSEMLGHATVAITLDLYSHVLPDMQKDAATAMERVLGI